MRFCEKDAVPLSAPRVEVAMTVASVALVPYAKPDWVALAPPVFVMAPLRVAVVLAIDEAALVARVGAVMEAAVVNISLLDVAVFPTESVETTS